jgi:RNA polymerase sigma factor (TIGR02999 family)
MNQETPEGDLDEFSALLEASRTGDKVAWSKIIAYVYGDLRRMAKRHRLSSGHDGTLNTTGLVHESYLRMTRAVQQNVSSRAHFFSLASRVMRQVVCDYARERLSLKRGGAAFHTPIEDEEIPDLREARSMLEIDESLRELEKTNPRWARIVEMRFFSGLGETEAAEALGISLRTVQREWREAREWLAKRVG